MCSYSSRNANTSELETLRSAIELRQMREECVQKQQNQKEFATMLRSRDEELQHLRERILQLSSSDNINFPAGPSSLSENPRNELD